MDGPSAPSRTAKAKRSKRFDFSAPEIAPSNADRARGSLDVGDRVTFRAVLGDRLRRKRIRLNPQWCRPKRTIWTFRTVWTMHPSSPAETVMAPSNTQKHARAPVAITRSAVNDIAAVLIQQIPRRGRPRSRRQCAPGHCNFEDRREAPAPAAGWNLVPAEEVAQALVDPASRQAYGRTASKRLIDLLWPRRLWRRARVRIWRTAVGEGKGLGKRVAAYATPVRLEDSAGRVAGPGKLSGISERGVRHCTTGRNVAPSSAC